MAKIFFYLKRQRKSNSFFLPKREFRPVRGPVKCFVSKNDVSFFNFSFNNVIPIIVSLIFFRRSFSIRKTENFFETFVSFFARFFRFVERFRAAAAAFIFWNGYCKTAAVSDLLSGTSFNVRIAIIGKFEDAFAALSIVPHKCHPVESDEDILTVFIEGRKYKL